MLPTIYLPRGHHFRACYDRSDQRRSGCGDHGNDHGTADFGPLNVLHAFEAGFTAPRHHPYCVPSEALKQLEQRPARVSSRSSPVCSGSLYSENGAGRHSTIFDRGEDLDAVAVVDSFNRDAVWRAGPRADAARAAPDCKRMVLARLARRWPDQLQWPRTRRVLGMMPRQTLAQSSCP